MSASTNANIETQRKPAKSTKSANSSHSQFLIAIAKLRIAIPIRKSRQPLQNRLIIPVRRATSWRPANLVLIG